MSLSHVSLIFKKLEPVDQCTEGDNLIAGLTANPLIFIPADLPMTTAVLVTDTHKKGTVKGLTTKDEMEWQMVATNAAGSGPLSEKVSVLVS